MLAHLSIGTTTNRISLLSEKGFMLNGWPVGGTEYGTIFQESQLADYRQLVAYRDVTTIETFELVLRAASQDVAAARLQDLRAICRLCLDYWTTTYQTSVVYLAARASCETNMRYAVLHDARLVQESNPFGQPFLQAGGHAVMDTLALIVERGPWLENVPGTGTCVEISSQGADYDAFVLDFDGTDDRIVITDAASIQDLPDADFTAEAWIKARDWGENNRGYILDKGYWFVGIENYIWAQGISVGASFVGGTATTYTGLDDFAPDNEWHHVAAVWEQSTLTWDIALDGVWVTTTKQAGAGAYQTDVGVDLRIGNNPTTARTFDGQIGWSRISDIHRYTVGVNFTPPGRCDCPSSDGDTVALWCMSEGTGATTYDETANNNDGAITGAAWTAAGCETEYMEATCDDLSVFVGNKSNVAQITHAYFWDDSATQWTDGGAPPENLIGKATPFDFLPGVPNDDDFVMFGINTALVDSGPFSSLIFDISTAIDPGTLAMEWRYCANGDGDDPAGWTALTVQDNTDTGGDMVGDPFDTEGIGSVHWSQPSDWVTCDPDPTGANAIGVTGYWVCCYCDASGGAGVDAPQQDNRDFYTVTWPYIDLTADQVTGDMPALLRLAVAPRSAQDAVPNTTTLWVQRLMVGLRDVGRGDHFNAYINISNEQLPTNVTITLGAGMGAFATNTQAPTGMSSTYTAAGVDAIATRVTVEMDSHWYGRFHAFVRGKQVTGNPGEVLVRLGYAPGDAAAYADKRTVTRTFVSTNDDQLLDFGEIVLGPAVDTYPYVMPGVNVIIEAGATAASSAIFYDLILLPIDEWAWDCEDMFKSTNAANYIGDYKTHINVDAIQNPRTILSHLVRTSTGQVTRYWRPITNGIPILQTGKHQRLWFLQGRFSDYADEDDLRANSEICSTLQVWKNQRYSTLRGNR